MAGTGSGWRALLGREYLGTSTLLASGEALSAANTFLTMTLLPSAISDIGGQRLFAWATALYLIGSVAAAPAVHWMLRHAGARGSYLLALAVFAVGSLVCAAAPSMGVLVAGRVLQGAAAGLLRGLAYAVINTALPRPLWGRAYSLIAIVWAVATLIGPVAGGVFAEFGVWRWAFGTMAMLTVPVAVLVPFALAREAGESRPAIGVSVWSVLLLTASAVAVSLADLPRNPLAAAGLLGTGAALVVVFVLVDRRIPASVLPPSVFRPGPPKWVYLSMASLMAATMVDTYIPLFGQHLAHLNPVQAGFLGASPEVGWTVAAIVSAPLTGRAVARAVAIVPAVMPAGLLLATVTQRADAAAGVAVWVVALLLVGAGAGAAWPHLTEWAMGDVGDPAENTQAASAINIVQLIGGAFGAALAGVVVNEEPDDMVEARRMFALFTVVAVGGAVTAYRAARYHPR